MRKTVLFFLLSFLVYVKNSNSQTVFWRETFGTGCNQGSLANGSVPTASNGAWTTSNTGVNGTQSNEWFISATEAGFPNGQCGDGCVNTVSLSNRSLHIGSNITSPNLDPGAVYLQNANSVTDKRVESFVIDFSNYTNVSLSLNYLTNGVPSTDYAEINFSLDGGATWSFMGTLGPSMGTCTPKGLWTTKSVPMAIASWGESAIKLGFRWRNGNAIGSGNVSVAIDEITLSGQPLVGINPLNLDRIQLKLFPNPVSSILYIISEKYQLENSEIEILNIVGQTVLKTNFSATIDVSKFSKGLYYLKIKSEGKLYNSKFIKE